MLLSLKRAVRVCAVIAGWLLFDFGLLNFLPDIPYAHIGGPDFPETVFVVSNIAILVFLIYYRHRRRNYWIQEEAERWLVRRARQSNDELRRRDQLFRRLLWIPSLLALAAFLLLPEVFGMGLRLIYRGTANLSGHHIKVPITWWAFTYPQGTNKNLYLSAIVGKGIARVGPRRWWRREPPLSSMLFYAETAHDNTTDKPPSQDIVVSERVLPFGKDVLTCRELAVTTDVTIRCVTSSDDFTAQFGGEWEDVSAFYRVLETATN